MAALLSGGRDRRPLGYDGISVCTMRTSLLKTTYQRNLLMGQGASLLIAAIAIMLILLLQESYVVIDLQENRYLESFPLPPDGVSDNNDIGPINAALLAGVRPRATGNNTAGTGYNHNLSPGFGYAGINRGNFLISGDYYGDAGGDLYPSFVTGDTSDAWPITQAGAFIPEYSFKGILTNRSVTGNEENRPLMINFVKPRYPGGLRYKCDAIVKLGFYVTHKGFISKIDILIEEPAGFGFALAVKEALRDSWIRPAVINGQKAGGYYILTYEFCEKCPEKPVVVESEGNVVVTVK